LCWSDLDLGRLLSLERQFQRKNWASKRFDERSFGA